MTRQTQTIAAMGAMAALLAMHAPRAAAATHRAHFALAAVEEQTARTDQAAPLPPLPPVPPAEILQTQGLTPDQQFELEQERLQLQRRDWQGGAGVLVPLGFFAFILLIVWLGIRQKHAVIRSQAELRKQLIDKFGSGAELTAFLESKGGQEFLKELRTNRAPSYGQRGLTAGIVLTMLGLGFAFLKLTHPNLNLEIPAVILLALGIGFLISAGVSYKLNKSREHDAPRSGLGPGGGSGSQPILPA